MRHYSLKDISKKIAIVLALAMIFTGFAFTQQADAAAKPDLKKANVKWDLKKNKKLKYKQYWYAMGVKTHTVKMTNYKVANAETPGFKKCTFTLTYKMKVKPSKQQVKKMGTRAGSGKNYTEWYFTVVDYKTGKSLEAKNDKNVTVTYTPKFSKYKTHKGIGGSWIRYPRKSVYNVTIVYPENYKDLAIGVGGCSSLKSANAHFRGSKSFSKTKSLYSKKDKKFAHFMRVK